MYCYSHGACPVKFYIYFDARRGEGVQLQSIAMSMYIYLSVYLFAHISKKPKLYKIFCTCYLQSRLSSPVTIMQYIM